MARAVGMTRTTHRPSRFEEGTRCRRNSEALDHSVGRRVFGVRRSAVAQPARTRR